MNLCLVSLDRLHATLFPFRHCLTTERLYYKIILVSWLISFLLAVLMAGLYLNEPFSTFSYVVTSFDILTLLVLTVSSIFIIRNVQSSPHSQNHGSTYSERKLSVTLLLVTGVSILTILPWTIYKSIPGDIKTKWRSESSDEIHEVLAVIYFANSFVNPLLYAIRMKEFRKAIGNLVIRKSQAKPGLPKSRAKQKRVYALQLETM